MSILIVKETDFILTWSVDGVAESYKKESISELHDDELITIRIIFVSLYLY